MADAIVKLTLSGRGPGSLAVFRRQLERPEKLLKLFGMAAASEAQRSFDRQGLHFEDEWEPRYPSQQTVYVNIAGAIMDLTDGPTIKAHRFDNRPAVVDTGLLRRSLSPSGAVSITGTFEVSVGTTVPYGGKHQFGGEEDIPITQAVKDNLRTWYKRQTRDIKKMGKEFINRSFKFTNEDEDSGDISYETIRRKEKNLRYDAVGAKEKSAWLRAVMSILAPIIFHKDSHHQLILQREFIGLNDDLAHSFRRIAIDFYAGKGVAA